MKSKWKRNGGLAITVILGAFAAPQAFAQADFAAGSVHRFYAFAGGAAFVHQQNSGLQNEQNSFANAMVGGGFRTSPNLAVELAWLLGGHTVDTPSTATPPAGTFTAGTQKSTIATAGLAATAKYNFTGERFMPYAGGGMGWYSTQFRTTTEEIGCTSKCSDSGPRVTANDSGLGYHVMVGFDYHFTPKDVFGTELRYLKLDAKFGDVVPGKVNAGGTFLWLGYRRVFR